MYGVGTPSPLGGCTAPTIGFADMDRLLSVGTRHKMKRAATVDETTGDADDGNDGGSDADSTSSKTTAATDATGTAMEFASARRRIAILGGSFNPITDAHLQVIKPTQS